MQVKKGLMQSVVAPELTILPSEVTNRFDSSVQAKYYILGYIFSFDVRTKPKRRTRLEERLVFTPCRQIGIYSTYLEL